MKILYFDTETTGINPQIHEITQFAGIVEIDGKVVEEINVRCQPTNWDAIDPKAIETTGITIEELKTFQKPGDAVVEIHDFLSRHVNKYDKADKYYPAGHNVQFDLDFLQAFWKKNLDSYGIGSFQNWRALDSRVFANFLIASGRIKADDVKLETLANYFGIKIDAHDALSDIRATREVIKKMFELIK